MLRKTTRFMILLIFSLLAIGQIIWLTSCEYAVPTPPCDCPDEPVPIVKTVGTIPDENVTTKQKVYNEPETGEMSNRVIFVDTLSAVIGEAELTAAADLVAHISIQQYNIPGETYVEIGSHYTLKVVVTTYQPNPTKYTVELTNMDTGQKLTFLIDKIGLGKASTTAGVEAAANIDPTQFTGLVSTNCVLLCVGTEKTIKDSEACKEAAPAYCDALGVKESFIEAYFSMANGCESGCKVICKVHDQGGIGFE